MNILLVNPPLLDRRNQAYDTTTVPIGLYYIAAEVMSAGHRATILNLSGQAAPIPCLIRQVKEDPPDIAGFSILSANRHGALMGAKVLKEQQPGIKIVFGGPGAVFLSEWLFSRLPELDYVVSGEGEVTFRELIDHLADPASNKPQNIPGLISRSAAGIAKGGKRVPLPDLDALTDPADYFTFSHVALTRGCPGSCTFCGSPKFWGKRKVRGHSAEYFVNQIEKLFKKGVRHFHISDDTFTWDRAAVLSVCRLIEKRQLEITFNVISRADCIDAEVLYHLRRAGCIQISFGVESGSAVIRKRLGKPMEAQTIKNAFRLTSYYGILPRAYFIYGSPGETDQTIKESIDLMHQIRPLSAIFYMLMAFPGTYLYDQLKKENRLTDDVWEEPVEDLPWFYFDDGLSFEQVTVFGESLRSSFFTSLDKYARDIRLIDDPLLYHRHAEFLTRLAMTFIRGEYAGHPMIKNRIQTARALLKRALGYAKLPDTYLGEALCHQKERRFEQALKTVEVGLKLFESDNDLLVLKGIVLMNMGVFDKALTCFETVPDVSNIQPYMEICRKKLNE